MKVLVLNSGSSSIKYRVFEMKNQAVLASGRIERIGESHSRLEQQTFGEDGTCFKIERAVPIQDHRQGITLIAATLRESAIVTNLDQLYGIGHRVVHGGSEFHAPTLINDQVLTAIRHWVPLAPLHNPANIVGIEAALAGCPHVPQVAVFDTAFHQSMPPHAYLYALPREFHEQFHVRRYGFHGTSHFCVAKRAAQFLGRPLESLNLITLHLGNGASVAAIQNGNSIDTSMGMTPLEGLIMGTRCGDLDPGVVFYLSRATGKSPDEVESILVRSSGLKGLCGENDMREIIRMAREGNESASLAVEMYCYRVKKYIGAYMAVLGCVDAIVFTGGIGENASEIRAQCLQGLAPLGITMDPEKNEAGHRDSFEIHVQNSSVGVLVIPTDEELEIATATWSTIRATSA